MGASYYTTPDGTTVAAFLASERSFRGSDPSKAYVEVSFPNAQLDRVSIFRPFDSLDAAKNAARAIAEQIKGLCPKGTHLAWSKPRMWTPGDLKAREAIDGLVRPWAGESAVVLEV